MASVANASALFDGALNGNMRKVKAALAAGANANGSPERPYTPIMAATAADEVSIVKFLIGRGVDPDRSADHDLPCPSMDEGIMPGERALHIAAKRGKVAIVRLLKRGRADFNATDTRGRTPLMAACACLKDCVPVARVLLELGANPALADNDGFTPLHAIAQHGVVTDLVDMLYTGAPNALTRCSFDGRTPLFTACVEGHESMVSQLLSLGAMQGMCPHDPGNCPLVVAAAKGFEGVVRVLIKEGRPAVGVVMSLPYAIYGAIQSRHAKILQLLISAEGEGERRSYWANITLDRRQPLHVGAAICYPAAVNILLAAGADETALDFEGHAAIDVIGLGFEMVGVQMDREKEVAIRRMLEQGPAYRARSWAWPAEDAEDSGGCGDGGAVVLSPPAAPKAPVSVRIFRPKDDRIFFVSIVDRYCRKG